MDRITEEWARTTTVIMVLDRVVAKWMGTYFEADCIKPYNEPHLHLDFSEPGTYGFWEKYSTNWSAAGALLKALSQSRSYRGMIMDILAKVMRKRLGRRAAFQDLTPIDISRTVAVLVARNITRSELEDERDIVSWESLKRSVDDDND